jgi:hypothetical protein
MNLTTEDRLDLLQVQHLYGHILDGFLWDRLGEVFAPDGVFDASDVGLPPARGLAAIREGFVRLEARNGAMLNHVTTNAAIIAVGEDGIVRMRAKYIVAGIETLSFGEYEDDCVKTPDGWRIAHRKTRRTIRHRAIPPQ